MQYNFENTRWNDLGAAIKRALSVREPPMLQADLAKELKITPAAVTYLVRGRGDRLSLQTVKEACAKLDVDLQQFVDVPKQLVSTFAFCPNEKCPGCYVRVGLAKVQVLVPIFFSGHVKFCVECSSRLVAVCPRCQAAIERPGPYCGNCGASHLDQCYIENGVPGWLRVMFEDEAVENKK